MRYGKTLVHWFFKISNEIYGVFPPTLDDIQTEPKNLKLFVDSIFVQKTRITHTTKLKRIIADSIMIFHQAFSSIIGNKPYGKYKDPNHHPFHKENVSNLSEKWISMETFRKCQNEAIEGLNNRN